jgi:hypothetical protein
MLCKAETPALLGPGSPGAAVLRGELLLADLGLPDGDLTKHDAEDIAIGMMWDGDPTVLLEALVASRWVDRNGTGVALHDWDEYGGKLVERRRADAARKAQERARKKEEKERGPSEDVRGTSNGRAKDRRQNAKNPRRTLPLCHFLP